MSIDIVEKKVREIAAEQLGLALEEVQLDASISNDLGADTLDFLELVMAFEEEFEVEISEEDAERFNVLQDIVNHLTGGLQ